MKTTEIKDLLKKDLLIIETPLNATNIIFYEGDNSLTWETENHIIKGYDLEGYTLLGKPDEISEDAAEDLVDEIIVENGNGILFKNYKIDQYNLVEATESLLSAIEAAGVLWENPYLNAEKYNEAMLGHGEKNGWEKYRYSQNRLYLVKIPSFKQQMKLWHEAKSRTFDRSRTLIFVKQ